MESHESLLGHAFLPGDLSDKDSQDATNSVMKSKESYAALPMDESAELSINSPIHELEYPHEIPTVYEAGPLSDEYHRPFPLYSNDEQDNLHVNNFYITMPWSPQVYFTVRGAENFHIYLWIAKDLSWTRDAYTPAMMFGIASLLWCSVLMFHAVTAKCVTECYMLIVMILWIAANFLWMSGEVFSGDDDQVLSPASYIMEGAIGMVLLYHLVLRPLKIIPKDDMMNSKYEDADLTPRISYFRNWREYEHFHTVCWLGKDLSWNRSNIYTWCLCFIPTFLIAIDFMYSSYKTKKMAIDFAHYVSMFIWVIASAVWGAGNIIFLPYVAGYADDWTTYPLISPPTEAIRTCRWWASIVLICAFIPIICLYIIWLPLTCSGRIIAANIPENFDIKRSSFSSFSIHLKKKRKRNWFKIFSSKGP